MDLAFGTTVKEHFYSIGRLAGLEADRQTRAVRSILISGNGAADAAEKRPLSAVPADHFSGDIELRAFPEQFTALSHDGTVTLTAATRLVRQGHEIGHLEGVELDPSTGAITAVTGRHHWWTPKVHLQAANLDFSVPGEIRVR